MVGFVVVNKETELNVSHSYRTEDNKPAFEFREYLGCKSLDNIPETHVYLVEISGVIIMDNVNKNIGYASEIFIIHELTNSEIMVQLWTNSMGVNIIYNDSENNQLINKREIICEEI